MTHTGGRRSSVRWAVVSAGLAAVGAGLSTARADRITLRGGGQIRGKVIADPRRPDRVSVLTERGKTPLSFQKAQVLQVTPEPSALDDYVVKRGEAAATAEGQYGLGLWCEQHKLHDLAELHYEAALAHDKAFGPAHKKLGHVQVRGQWLSGDQLRTAQGLVRLKGKWVTQEEKETQEKNHESAAEQSSWVRRVRQLYEAIAYGADDRRREAEAQLMAIRDPAAVGPLVKVLGVDAPAARVLLAHVLGSIPGPESATALVNLLVFDGDSDVRHAALDELERRKEPEAAKRLVRALRATTPEVVNRAAWALANLHEVGAVPSLVGALVTTRQEVVMGQAADGGASISATFGAGGGQLTPATPVSGGVPAAYNGSSIGYLTGPVVGPGVAAFGMTGVPVVPLPNPVANLPGGMGAAMTPPGLPANGGLNASRGPSPRLVAVTVQNAEVLAALVKLTGRDFGYDTPAWRRWLRTSFQPDPAPARRVPQP